MAVFSAIIILQHAVKACGKRGGPDPLRMELQTILSLHTHAGIQSGSSERAATSLNN